MNIAEIESDLGALVDEPFNPEEFVFRLMEIYKAPKASITKLKQAPSPVTAQIGDVIWKNKLFFRVAAAGKSAESADALLGNADLKKYNPRFIFVTDGIEVHCRDVRTRETFNVAYQNLNDEFLFLLPLAGIERYEAISENPADIKATGRLAKLYDAILEANPLWIDRDHTHELNLFMTRMLFCFFAESTSIFEEKIFTQTVMSRSNEDGSDMSGILGTSFEAMNTPKTDRHDIPRWAHVFEYVNGKLFRDKTAVPQFSKRARRLMKECGELIWKDINPDLFGSMIQAIAEPGMREDIGMHYTSVPNIIKVLKPLFLDSLELEFAASFDSESRLQRLLNRIYNLRVFDPACGSGNFLIIAYKELRKLETRIFERQREIAKQWSLQMTGIQLTQFYGIELTDFAAETAKLSLWIAEYQMNEQFAAVFGKAPPALPLRDSGNVVQGNAARLPWASVCDPDQSRETYIVGNPPYLGRAGQSDEQKADMAATFSGTIKKYKNLDYVACWIVKASEYIKGTTAEFAFVTTNSICQGEQVDLLWSTVLDSHQEIGFAHLSFLWRNSASANAAVTCVIVGVRNKSNGKKYLMSEELRWQVKNISPYLIDFDNVIVKKRSKPLSAIPKMDFGSMPNDGGNLLATAAEKVALASDPKSLKFLRRFYGSKEFLQGHERWCIWVKDPDLIEALSIPAIAERIGRLRANRLSSDRPETRALADFAHRFGEIRHQDAEAIIVPRHFSEDRDYVAIGLLDGKRDIIGDAACAVFNPPGYLFALMSSRLHLLWTATVGGRIKTDYRYSSTLVYNTFPVGRLSPQQMEILEEHAIAVLGARENHPGRTIAWLYNPETMPEDLRRAHLELDETVEEIYVGRTFRNDRERVEHLFKMYATMIKNEGAGYARRRKAP